MTVDDQAEVRDYDGVKVYVYKYRTSELGKLVTLGLFDGDVLNLDRSVRAGVTVTQPDWVVVLGPPNHWLKVTVSRPGPPGQHADVVQHGAQLYEDAVRLPSNWFQSGDVVQVERTQPHEPRRAAPESTVSSLVHGSGEGTGDLIARRGR
jgi:hypothetical protein